MTVTRPFKALIHTELREPEYTKAELIGLATEAVRQFYLAKYNGDKTSFTESDWQSFKASEFGLIDLTRIVYYAYRVSLLGNNRTHQSLRQSCQELRRKVGARSYQEFQGRITLPEVIGDVAGNLSLISSDLEVG